MIKAGFAAPGIRRRLSGLPELVQEQESCWREDKQTGVREVVRAAAGWQKPGHSSRSIPSRYRKYPLASPAAPSRSSDKRRCERSVRTGAKVPRAAFLRDCRKCLQTLE